jgi:hypothetical protein
MNLQLRRRVAIFGASRKAGRVCGRVNGDELAALHTLRTTTVLHQAERIILGATTAGAPHSDRVTKSPGSSQRSLRAAIPASAGCYRTATGSAFADGFDNPHSIYTPVPAAGESCSCCGLLEASIEPSRQSEFSFQELIFGHLAESLPSLFAAARLRASEYPLV